MQSETAISRELMGKIVDEVFDGAIEDVSVIEEIYAVIKREEANLSKFDERKPLDLNITQDWFEKRSALEADHEIGAGSRKLTACIDPTPDELAELFKIAHRIPDGWKLVPVAALSAAEPQPAPSVAVKALQAVRSELRVDASNGKPGSISYEVGALHRIVAAVDAALCTQAQDVAGLESNPVTLRWWCQQLLDIIENHDITHDSCDEEIALINDIRSSVDPAAAAKQEGGTNE